MADYNVNMKQWNGTSFDNVLPLAYNAKQLGGQSLAEVKQWVQDNGLLLYTGSYIGTGTYGESLPTKLTFPFEPIIIFMPAYLTYDNHGWDIIQTNMVMESYYSFYNTFDSGRCYIKSSTDRKTFSLYDSGSAGNQYNNEGQIYYFAAIGGYDMGGVTEWLINSSRTWTVPRTGRYYIELYGMGGRGEYYYSNYASGGSSCQSYDNVQMTKGSSIAVVIGSNSSSKTSFGSKSVDNAGNATDATTPGKGTGNLGADGAASSSGNWVINYGKGVWSKYYGSGGGNRVGPGAVYIKYLGA